MRTTVVLYITLQKVSTALQNLEIVNCISGMATDKVHVMERILQCNSIKGFEAYKDDITRNVLRSVQVRVTIDFCCKFSAVI
jgi:hypothetical protein